MKKKLLEIGEEDVLDPLLAGAPPEDHRVRHFARLVTPPEFNPPAYDTVALCGAKISDIGVAHNGEICQECVDIMRRKP